MIVVHGATGHVGSELVKQLAQAGHHVRALSRRPQQSTEPNISWVSADAASGDGLDAAFRGADRAFLMSAEEIKAGERPVQVPRLVASAVRAGVRQLVLLSVFSGGNGADVIAEFWRHVEDAVRESGASWTILRPGRFMSNALQWIPMLARGDEVQVPFARRKVASIDPTDIAAVAAAALTSTAHAGQCYQLTGGEPLSPAEELTILGEQLQRPLRALDAPLEALRAGMARHGITGPVLEAILARMDTSDGSEPLPTVQQLLGRSPRTFRQWAREHLASFAVSPTTQSHSPA